MPFGMMNSSTTVVRAMRKFFQGMGKVDSYVDDTIVHTDVAGPRNCPS